VREKERERERPEMHWEKSHGAENPSNFLPYYFLACLTITLRSHGLLMSKNQFWGEGKGERLKIKKL
jgi:hypothetical protein